MGYNQASWLNLLIRKWDNVLIVSRSIRKPQINSKPNAGTQRVNQSMVACVYRFCPTQPPILPLCTVSNYYAFWIQTGYFKGQLLDFRSLSFQSPDKVFFFFFFFNILFSDFNFTTVTTHKQNRTCHHNTMLYGCQFTK